MVKYAVRLVTQMLVKMLVVLAMLNPGYNASKAAGVFVRACDAKVLRFEVKSSWIVLVSVTKATVLLPAPSMFMVLVAYR